MAALFERERTGRGRRVDVPMVDTMIGFLTNPIGQYFASNATPDPYQRPSHSQCFVFRCADGRMISIHMSAPQKFWEGMLRAIGRPELKDDPRFASNSLRIENYDELGQVIGPSFVAKSRAQSGSGSWRRTTFPLRRSMISTTLCKILKIRHLGTFDETEHPSMGTVKGLARPVFFDGERDFEAVAAYFGPTHGGSADRSGLFFRRNRDHAH